MRGKQKLSEGCPFCNKHHDAQKEEEAEKNRELYTIEELSYNVTNVEGHFGRFVAMDEEKFNTLIGSEEGMKELCLDCLKKHSSDMGGLCKEADGFFPDEESRELWGDIRDLAVRTRELSIELGETFDASKSFETLKAAKEKVIPFREEYRQVRKQLDPRYDELLVKYGRTRDVPEDTHVFDQDDDDIYFSLD